jgi:putative transposase
MSRLPRPVLKNVPLHIIQRGNNRNPCFFARADYQVYLAMLGESAAEHGCSVHAYALMPNHVHILASPAETSSPARMMKNVGERYVKYVNRRYNRFGTLWQGRYRSCLVDDEQYFLVCQRYIELNPVRAAMVSQPIDYDWSSFRANAYGVHDSIITPHIIYVRLGTVEMERQASYRALFQEAIPETLLDQVRHATNRNAAFGSPSFVDDMGVALGRDLDCQPAGRRSI